MAMTMQIRGWLRPLDHCKLGPVEACDLVYQTYLVKRNLLRGTVVCSRNVRTCVPEIRSRGRVMEPSTLLFHLYFFTHNFMCSQIFKHASGSFYNAWA